jgi:PAS domain S-box-containing protein
MKQETLARQIRSMSKGLKTLRERAAALPEGQKALFSDVLSDLSTSLAGLRAAGKSLAHQAEGLDGARAAAQQDSDRLSALINSIGDEVWLADTKKRFTLMNKAALREFGLASARDLDVEKLALSLEVLRPDGSPRPVEEAPPLRALQGEVITNQEEIVRTPRTGSLRYRQVSAAPILDSDGNIMGSVSIVRDITQGKRREQQLHKLNRTLEALRESNQALTQARNESDFLDRVCKIIVEDCGHALVWIGYAEDDKNKTVRPVACAGFEEGYLETLRITWADTPRGRGPTGMAVRSGKPALCNNMLTDPRFTPWRAEALRRGYASSIAVPIMADGKAFGAIMIYSRQPEAFSEDEVDLLRELADDVARGITSIRLRAAHARAEEAVHQSERRFRLLFETMLQGVVYQDEEGKIISMNPSAERILGQNPEEFLGQTSLDQEPFTIREDGSPFPGPEHPSMVALRTGKQLSGIVMGVFNPREQRYRWISIDAVPLFRRGKDRPYRVYTMFDDITSRKEIEAELRRSHDELETRIQERTAELRRQAELLDLAHDAILVRTPEEVITFWNTGAEEIYGWAKDAALGEITHDLLRTQSPVSRADMNAAILSQGRWEGELTHFRRDGKPLLVFSRQVLRKEEAGRPAEILEINQDISERRQAEERVRQSQKMEALGTLAGGIAHDFNNILMPILINMELAVFDLPRESSVSQYLKLALEAGKRGKELVRQIIAFSSQKEQRREPVNIAVVVREAVKFLRASIPSSIEISEHIAAESSVVRADATQIHQILMNLGSNAAQAMREGEGRIEIRLEEIEADEDAPSRNPALPPGGYCQLTLSDTGQGMTKDVMDKAFDPFFTTKKPGEGTGMGLSVVHGIVKNHGGFITVTSEVGKGTTFTVLLPLMRGDLEPVSPRKERISARAGTERILFVDDEDILVRSMVPALERLGYRVTGVSKAGEALALFRERPEAFDLVITDQTMPFMTGEKLAREILHLSPDIPVILCTGFSEVIDEDAARALGIREFMLKPFSISEIAETIRKALKKN